MGALDLWWHQNEQLFLIAFVAMGMGFVLGLQRIFLTLGASIRIHMAVALGAAMFVQIPIAIHPDLSVGSLVQGIATGVGFIGAGAILQRPEKGTISGISVAGNIW